MRPLERSNAAISLSHLMEISGPTLDMTVDACGKDQQS